MDPDRLDIHFKQRSMRLDGICPFVSVSKSSLLTASPRAVTATGSAGTSSLLSNFSVAAVTAAKCLDSSLSTLSGQTTRLDAGGSMVDESIVVLTQV